MRNIISFILPALCLFSSCAKNSSVNDAKGANDLTKGLIAHYPFNGNSNDESGNNYHLTVNEAVPGTNRFGESSKAYSFNGTSSYMTIPNMSKADSLTELTISLWVKPDVLKTERILSFFANPGVSFCNHFSGFLQINGAFLMYHEMVTDYNDFGCSMTNTKDSIDSPAGTWTHIVLVQHYTDNPVKKYNYSSYLNGKKLEIAPTLGVSGPNPKAVKLSLGGIVGCSIGHLNFFSGDIDDVRIYDRALSENEIVELHNLPN